MVDQVCFDPHVFRGWLTLLVIVFAFMCYVVVKKKTAKRESYTQVDLNSHLSQSELTTKVQLLQDQLLSCQKGKQWCESELEKQVYYKERSERAQTFQRRDPAPPERTYISPKAFSTPIEYQNIGFVHGNGGRFPLFGRYREPGRSDKWEYFIVDESRNKLRIPFKTKNWSELYDGDTIMVPTIGEMKVSLYDYGEFRYNPSPQF